MKELEVLNLDTWKNEFTEEECNFDKVEEYIDLINECIDRFDDSRYSERHHVMPKCVDRDKKYLDQLVKLNGADHFLVHKKLIECFNGKLKSKMCFALTKLLGHLGPYISAEDYEYARRINAEALKGNKNAEGLVHTEEARKKMSLKHRKTDTEETKRKRSQSLMGHEFVDETRKQISGTLKNYYAENREKYGKSFSPDICDKISNSLYEHYKTHKVSEETKRKQSISVSGEKNGMYGKHHTEEARKKMSESRKGNQNAKGNIWITNGVNNKIIRDLADMPEGWRRGMTVKKSV